MSAAPAAGLPVAQLRHHPDNPPGRHVDVDELADSIRAVGILQPLLVEPDPSGGWVVLAGNRRLAAARSLGLTAVPCVVRAAHDDIAHTAVRLIENGHRRNLSPMEQAREFGRLRAAGRTLKEIRALTGFSMTHISNRLMLLELTANTQALVESGVLSAEAATDAARLARPPRQRKPPAAPVVTPPDGPLNFEREHFGRAHRLAELAAAICIGVHGRLAALGGLGGIACGRCWEAAIRRDAAQAPAVFPAVSPTAAAVTA